MKKILLVLFTLVLCLSSFKGMGQDPINGLCEPTIEFINLSQNLNTDVVGQWHNDFLDFLFEKIKTDNICPMDESFNFKYNSFVHEFMQTKGLELNNNLIGSIYDINSLEKINLCNEESSEATKALLCELEQLINILYSGKFQIEELINSAENIKISAEQLENSGEQKTIGLTASILKHSIIFWSSKYQEISGNLTNSCSQAGSHKSTFIQQDITYGMNRYLELEKTSTSIIKDFEPIILNSENGVSNWNWWMIAASDAMGAYRWGKVGLVAAGGPAGAIACGFAGAIGHSAISMLVQAATH